MRGNELAGTRFGRLTVIGDYQAGTTVGAKRIGPSIMCRCDCGTEKRVNVDNLRSYKTTSCGCFRSENSSKMWKELGKIGGRKRRKYPPVESSARDLFQKYMKRNPGDLQFEEFVKLTQLPCYYCGASPYQIYLNKNATDNEGGKFIYNGLDRIDNTRGYDKENIITSCGVCNFMRHKQTMAQFYMKIIDIVSNRKDDLIKYGLRIDN